MNVRLVRFLLPCLAAAFLFSCSSTPAELVAKHTKRGDEFAQKEKFKEAVIEYKNAVKAGPNDAALHFKLANAALEARGCRKFESSSSMECKHAWTSSLGSGGVPLSRCGGVVPSTRGIHWEG